MRICRFSALFLFALVSAGVPASGPSSLERIVSLNLCIDQLLPYIVPVETVAGLTSLSRDKQYSNMPQSWLERVEYHSGSIEQLIALEPTMVLASSFDSGRNFGLLEKRGIQVVRLKLPATVHGIGPFMEELAATVGGEYDPSVLQQVLGKYRSRLKPGQQVMLLEPNGYGASSNPFKQSVLEFIGLSAVLDNNGKTTLEELLARQPDVLVLDEASANYNSQAHKMFTRHPVLQNALKNTRVIPVHSSHWICPSPAVENIMRQITDELSQ